jgi:hypothetical protein
MRSFRKGLHMTPQANTCEQEDTDKMIDELALELLRNGTAFPTNVAKLVIGLGYRKKD